MQLYHYPFTAMASPCELRLYAASQALADAAADAAKAEVIRIEQTYSRYREDSVVGRINAAAGGAPLAVDEETCALINYATTAYAESDGLFDISSGVLREVWNFKLGQLPSPAAVAFCLKRVGWNKVQWDAPNISLQQGMELDFGGFGKEYAADRAATICTEQGIAHGLVELGGDIRVIGPHPDGSAWQIGIRNPRDPDVAMAVIPLKTGGLASSGDYERFMVIDGKRYSHILNPRTGRPVDQPMAGVTVVAPLCLLAGTAATVAMLQGEKGAPAWLNEMGLPHLWIDQAGVLGGDLVPKVQS
ncbi:FAD:protein FMN transferase [uncultured Zhongshania sp.]|uniref:FAD:protein FMN transferase n=1 Tax=uncultured Zhongshania sp. TaxID=1642288 RepID=UPI0025CBE008|nr:FAD:protein FMN transferase [uncultured Zhongshania sp.]